MGGGACKDNRLTTNHLFESSHLKGFYLDAIPASVTTYCVQPIDYSRHQRLMYTTRSTGTTPIPIPIRTRLTNRTPPQPSFTNSLSSAITNNANVAVARNNYITSCPPIIFNHRFQCHPTPTPSRTHNDYMVSCDHHIPLLQPPSHAWLAESAGPTCQFQYNIHCLPSIVGCIQKQQEPILYPTEREERF